MNGRENDLPLDLPLYNRNNELEKICDDFFGKIRGTVRKKYLNKEWLITTFSKDGAVLTKEETYGKKIWERGPSKISLTLSNITEKEWEELDRSDQKKYLQKFCEKQSNELADCLKEKEKKHQETINAFETYLNR